MSNNAERLQGGNFVSRWLTGKKEQRLAKAKVEADLAAETAAQPARKEIAVACRATIQEISSHIDDRVDLGVLGKIERTNVLQREGFTLSFQNTEGNLVSFDNLSIKINRDKSGDHEWADINITQQDILRLSLLTEIVSSAVSLKSVFEKRGKEKNRELLTSGNLDALSLDALVFEGKTTQEGQFRTLSGIIDHDHKLLVVQQGSTAYIMTQKLVKYTNENPSGYILTSIRKIELADDKNYDYQNTQGQQSISFAKADVEYLRQLISAMPEAEPTSWGLSYRAQYGEWLSNDEIEAKNAQEKTRRLEIKRKRQAL